MRLFLVRHGDALSKDADPARPLSETGREEVERVARHAADRGVEVSQIRHSGKTRAEETARTLASHLQPSHGAVEAPGLQPNDDVTEIADSLEGESDPLMLVGHLPFMERLAGYLVSGDPDTTAVSFETGALACFQRGDDGWSLDWTATPDSV